MCLQQCTLCSASLEARIIIISLAVLVFWASFGRTDCHFWARSALVGRLLFASSVLLAGRAVMRRRERERESWVDSVRQDSCSSPSKRPNGPKTNCKVAASLSVCLSVWAIVWALICEQAARASKAARDERPSDTTGELHQCSSSAPAVPICAGRSSSVWASGAPCQTSSRVHLSPAR